MAALVRLIKECGQIRVGYLFTNEQGKVHAVSPHHIRLYEYTRTVDPSSTANDKDTIEFLRRVAQEVVSAFDHPVFDLDRWDAEQREKAVLDDKTGFAASEIAEQPLEEVQRLYDLWEKANGKNQT